MSKCDVNGEFPVWGLLPRKETGVINLLSKTPKNDGRGVVIAIFDSGVDPAAPGLQVTTTGEVKVIERIDASGVGDVDTSTIVEPTDGCIKGVTGRSLKIPEKWVNPSGKYHIGAKSAYLLYPCRLKDQISKAYKDKEWDPLHRTYLAEAQLNLQKLDTKSGSSSKNSPPTTEVSSPTESKKSSDSSSTFVSHLEKLIKEDAESRVSMLNTMEKKINDIGPVYDCVVFNDGEVWRACIDTSEKGELDEGVLLGEYTITNDFSALTPADQFTVSINVHNDGNILEIVGMSSSHGTHVAAIAAANFPDDPDRNGVAPGAKIVSITIGDNRVGTMETGTGIVRAMARAMKSVPFKIDLINMSYGEQCSWSNSGRLGELAHDVVNKYGVMWVGSAGNEGPALTTVGVPPNFCSDSIIGVGAYVSPDMMTAQYSLADKLPGSPYTWSSRGPTADGGRGVSVCAPGGAITSVPCFTLRKNQLMNGTSMAAPHTAGCIALLMSGLKQAEIAYTPYSIRRALQNSARFLEIDPFAQGHGLVQVDKAMDVLLESAPSILDKINFIVECGKDREKGVYLRNWKANQPADWLIHVDPQIINESRAEPSDKLAFSLDLALSCDVPWVKVPTCLEIAYTNRSFKILLDPSGLERGRVYTGSIKAFISNEPQRGPVFDVPITMIVPHIDLINNYLFKNDPSQLLRIARHFIYAPQDATFAVITIRSSQSTTRHLRLSVHTLQVQPHTSSNTHMYYKSLNLGPNETYVVNIGVKGGLTLEVCLARWWACAIDGQIECTIDFHGLKPCANEISMLSGEVVQRFDVRSSLRLEDVLPQATLKHYVQVFVPIDSSIEVISGERDNIPDEGQVYQLVLTFNFSITKAQVEITPKFALLNDMLYESAFESQLWMLFDHNKHLITSGDAYYQKYAVKLDRGEYLIKLHIRHTRMDLLEKLTEMPLTILSKLQTEVKLDVYTSYNNAITGGRKASSILMSEGRIQPYYIVTPNITDKSLKPVNSSVGCYLQGGIAFPREELLRRADTYVLRVFLTDVPCKKRLPPSTEVAEKKDPKTLLEYQEALRDMQTTWLAKVDAETSEMIYKEVSEAHPSHLPALISRLQSMDNTAAKENKEKIIEITKKIIEAIDVPALLAYYGTKYDTRSDATKIRTQMDRQRNIAIDAWARLGCVYCSIMMAEPTTPSSTDGETSENRQDGLSSPELLDECQQISDQILKFVEPTESKVASFFIVYYGLRGFHGLSLKLVNRQAEEKYTKEVDMKLMTAFSALKWEHAEKLAKRNYPLRFPHAHHPF